MTLKRRYLILIIGLVVMISGVATAAYAQTGYGTVSVTEVDFQATDGSVIHSTLQRPFYATSIDPLPGVVVIHGSLQNKEWLMAFGIELARRGFVVLTIDANGHGNSDPGTGSGAAALDYIASLDFVDSSQIGLIGHSMGGGISWSAISESSVYVRALVLVGSGFWTEASYIPNTLVAVGNFDSLSSYPSNITKLEPYFNLTNISPNTTYGNFTDNTARRAIFPSTNHLFETIDPVIVKESVDWMKESLKGGLEDEHWIDSSNLMFSVWLIGGLFGLLGAILTVPPLMLILLGLPVFADLKKQAIDVNSRDTSSVLFYGSVYGLIGVITFFPFLIIGTLIQSVIPFPQYNGIPVMSWILGSGLIAALVLSIILSKSNLQLSVKETIEIGSNDDRFNLQLGVRDTLKIGSNDDRIAIAKTFFLAAIIITWLYILTLLVDIGLVLDLRCFLPGLHDLTAFQAILVPLYFIVFLVYFITEGAWFTTVMQPKTKGTWMRSQLEWTATAVIIKSFPYLILIAIEYLGGLLVGAPVIPGIIGYSWLFFYAFAPWFALCTVITVFAYRVTGNRWLGAMVNALICAWLLASILSFRG